MVPNPRTTIRVDRLRPLNSPTPITVEQNEKGRLVAIMDNTGTKPIDEVLDSWRVDDEWWRNRIARRYVELLLAGGGRLVIFVDLTTKQWYTQGA